jgi:hypothetical protein
VNKKVIKKIRKALLLATGCLVLVAGAIAGYVIWRTNGKVEIKFDIHLNKEAIYLSTYAEPPQFAIWLENPKNGAVKQVFVTYRAGRGDWEGKADVPVAIPHWTTVFSNRDPNEEVDGVSGATPKKETFGLQVEVKPGSEWICWIEMNLAGDYNEYYPQFNRITLAEDEFSCGQPALLYRAEIKATEGNSYSPDIVAMSLWNEGVNSLVPVDSSITTAQHVFDTITISIVKPKPRIVSKEVKKL